MAERPQAALRDVRRGEGPDELWFIDEEGTVTIAHAHGLNAEEALRTRERLLRLLAGRIRPDDRA